MGRIEVPVDALRYALYGGQLAALALAVLFVVLPSGGSTAVPLVVLFASLAVATVVGLWTTATDDDEGGSHPGTTGGVADGLTGDGDAGE